MSRVGKKAPKFSFPREKNFWNVYKLANYYVIVGDRTWSYVDRIWSYLSPVKRAQSCMIVRQSGIIVSNIVSSRKES